MEILWGVNDRWTHSSTSGRTWHGPSQQWNCEREDRTRCEQENNAAQLRRRSVGLAWWEKFSAQKHKACTKLFDLNNVELKLKTGRNLVTHASRLEPYFVPLPVETSAEFPETKMSEKFGKLSLRDLNQQPAGPDDFNDDDVPPPLHQHWLRGERKVSRQSSSSIPPARQPSQTFQPPPPPSHRLLRRPVKRHSLAMMMDK